MPFYLKEVDVIPEVVKFKSVLIVPCRFCPAVSRAVTTNQPFIDLHHGSLKTRCYEDLIASMQSRLEKEGVKTGVYRSSILNYTHCMWSPRKRSKLLKRASEFEAVLVIGCEGAYESVCEIVKTTSCRVFNAMETEGLLNVTPKIGWPFSVSLKLCGVTQMQLQKAQ